MAVKLMASTRIPATPRLILAKPQPQCYHRWPWLQWVNACICPWLIWPHAQALIVTLSFWARWTSDQKATCLPQRWDCRCESGVSLNDLNTVVFLEESEIKSDSSLLLLYWTEDLITASRFAIQEGVCALLEFHRRFKYGLAESHHGTKPVMQYAPGIVFSPKAGVWLNVSSHDDHETWLLNEPDLILNSYI